MTKRLLLSISFIIASLSLCTAQTTIRQQMDLLQQEHAISFVYDSSLPLDGAYKGASLKGLPLEQALERLFTHANIIYNIQGNHVLLKTGKAKTTNGKSYTVSGYVRDGQGELLINATVYDLTTQQGTMTNEYGHYSLTLPQGDHQLRATYIGFEQQVHSISLHHNQTLDIHLRASQQLGEVVVTGDLNSPVLGTQMGKRSISQADIKTEFALFSSPDVVKTLQRMSGVQEGVELTSGLYVHGGNNDENLFLLDGTPLYSYDETYWMPGYSHHSWSGQADYEHKTHRKGEKLTFSYMLALTRQHTEQQTDYLNMNNVPFDYTGNNYLTKENYTEHTIQADWTRPLWSGHKLDVGAKFIDRRNSSHNIQSFNNPPVQAHHPGKRRLSGLYV